MSKRKDRSPRPPEPLRARSPRAEPGDLLDALGLLRQRREPYAKLLSAVVGDTLQELVPAPDKLVVEIGAGEGQLRAWIPPATRAAWGHGLVHTDPSEAALRLLRQRAPDASTRVATAERLPFEAGSCGAVLGLCVFDAIQDEAAVVAELARVLTPGGRFLHFMDMATLLERPFEKLAASKLVPLPNVFGDPADHEWPLDIVLVRRDWLAGLLSAASRASHPLPAVFADYFQAFLGPFLGPDFDAPAATRKFKALASSGESRQALATLLESAARAAFQQGYPAIDPLPFHSGRYLESVMQACFRDSAAFRIERCAIVPKAAWEPATGVGNVKYRSLCVGHQRISDELPRRLLTPASEVFEDPRRHGTLIEVGVFVFVALRV